MVIDSSVLKISQFISPRESSYSMIYFVLLVIAYCIGQYLIIQFVTSKTIQIKWGLKSDIKLLLRLMTPLQFILAGILLSILLQIFIISAYNSLLLELSVLLSYGQSVCILAFLVYKFASWLKTNRSYSVILFLVAFISLATNSLFTLVYVADTLSVYSTYITANPGGYVPFSNPKAFLSLGFHVTSITSYILMWIATAILLRNNTKRLGRTRFWTLITLPLLYFLIQFQPTLLQLLFPLRLNEPIVFSLIYTLFFSVSKHIGGILFGIAFWSIGTKLSNYKLRDLMFLAAYGLILFFASNQAVLLATASFPPFGIFTISFIGLASYLVLVGIYSSAISVSQDMNLRKSIRNSLEQQSTLLGNIATSELEQRIASSVFNSIKRTSHEIEEESGIDGSMKEDDIRSYVSEIIKEMRQNRKK